MSENKKTFEEDLKLLKNTLKEMDQENEALNWRWIDQSQELFGKRDYQAEQEAWCERLQKREEEFKNIKNHQVIEKLKIGKSIMEIKEIIERIKKDEKEWRLNGCPMERKKA